MNPENPPSNRKRDKTLTETVHNIPHQQQNTAQAETTVASICHLRPVTIQLIACGTVPVFFLSLIHDN